MTNIVPGALWAPVDVGKRDARRKGRGVVGHIAVSNQTLLKPGPITTRPSDWHFYLPKSPYLSGQRFAQLIDLDLQSWSNYNANDDLAAWESEGGVGDDINGRWTENQIEAGAIILAYMNETEGVPIADMVNSLPGSRGFGVHRYGIDPYRVSGGEKWSSVYGKACPTDARFPQRFDIIARAHEIRGGSPSPSPALPPKPVETGRPTLPAWNLPAGHYVGDIKGPARSHGGYYANERPLIEAIQRALIFLNCVPGVARTTWATSSWADGRFERPYSTDAAVRFHNAFYPGQPYPDQIWSDDYAKLKEAVSRG